MTRTESMSLFTKLLRFPRFAAGQVNQKGVEGLSSAVATAASTAAVEYIGNPGTVVWDLDWDILLILDACRVDLIRDVDGFDFLTDKGTITSIASKSSGWLRRTFAEEYSDDLESAAYVTGNPFTDKVDLAEPAVLDEVWKYAWNDDISTVPARPITDRAIATWRKRDVDRIIVHYMQPHVPFVPKPKLGDYGEPQDFGSGFDDLWSRVGDEFDYNVVWNAYRENLEYVLEDVELLLQSVDADRVAVSADHGNAIGEWGIYGHPSDVLVPEIRRVPWLTTTAERTSDYEPTTKKVSDVDANVEERLKHLGYR